MYSNNDELPFRVDSLVANSIPSSPSINGGNNINLGDNCIIKGSIEKLIRQDTTTVMITFGFLKKLNL